VILGFDSFRRAGYLCNRGQSSSSTVASIKAALTADPDFDSNSITVTMLGPVAILEGYVAKKTDREKAVLLASSVVGRARVQDRMFCRVVVQ